MTLYVRLEAQLNEANLIRAGQLGDHRAVDKLFRSYRRRLLGSALRVLGNVADAEDALQDGMLSAYRALRGFEGRSRFSTWLTRIVVNAALMNKRALRVRAAVSLEQTNDIDEVPLSEPLAHSMLNPEEEFARTELRELIVAKVDELSPPTRAAFVLCEVEGYSMSEAAQKLGVTQSAIKARVWRACQRLAMVFAGDLDGIQANRRSHKVRRTLTHTCELYGALGIGLSQTGTA